MSTEGMPTVRLSPPVTGWEYKVLKINIDGFFFGPDLDPQVLANELNRVGQEDWELVNTVDINRGNGRTAELVAIFKRPLRG